MGASRDWLYDHPLLSGPSVLTISIFMTVVHICNDGQGVLFLVCKPVTSSLSRKQKSLIIFMGIMYYDSKITSKVTF